MESYTQRLKMASILGRILQICTLIVFMNLSIAPFAHAEEVLTSGREVQKMVKEQYVGDDSFMEWQMVLTSKSGFKRERLLHRYMIEKDRRKKILIRFLGPPDLRKTGMLTWEHKDVDDTQFLYLPAIKKTRRIAAGDKDQSFAGSDYNYEDMGDIPFEEYTYSDATTDTKFGEECYFYEAYAKPGTSAVYDKIRIWASKKSFIRIYLEYFSKKDALIKIGTAKNIEKINDIWTPLYTSMETLEDKHKTEIHALRVLYNQGSSKELFTLDNLETAAHEDF